MRVIRFVAAVILSIAASSAISLSQQGAPIKVSIMTPTPIVKSGVEIRVQVSVTNISEHAVDLYRALGPNGQAEAANQVEVYDANGIKLPRIDGRVIHVQGGTRHLPKQWISRKSVSVSPGETSEDFLILSSLFDMSKPGSYTVALRQEMRADDSNPDVKMIYADSNKIVIAVTE